MVSETESEVATAEAPKEDAPVEDAPTEGAEEKVETPEEDAQPDPLAELRKELVEGLAELKGTAATKDELNPLRSNVGRIDGIQSAIDDLSKRDPLAEVDPRITANEQLTAAVAQALLDSDEEGVSVASKETLRTAFAAVEVAKGTRDRAVLKQELLSEIQKTAQPQQEAPETENPATAEVRGYAAAKGVEFVDIPATAWQLAEGETLATAVTRVKGVVDSLANGAGAAERVADRREAAGPGSPARSGNTNRIDSLLTKLDTEVPNTLDEDETKAIAKHFGVKVNP